MPLVIPNAVVSKVINKDMMPIRAWREHLGLTQAEVARRLGISQSAYAQQEAREPVRKSTREDCQSVGHSSRAVGGLRNQLRCLTLYHPDLPQPQRSVTTLENPEVFKQEMQDAGFRNVEIRRVTKPFPVTTIPEFWTNMVKGSAPLQMMKKSMGEAAWREKEPLALAYLEEKLADGATELTSDAWLGIGVK